MSDEMNDESKDLMVRSEDLPARRSAMPSVAQLVEEGELLARSGMFGITSPQSGAAFLMVKYESGKTLEAMMAEYHVIDGRLAKRADWMQAEFQRRGGRVRFIESTADVCRAEFSHPDLCPEPFLVTQTKAEHVESGLAIGKNGTMKTNWARFPRQMLRARAISEGVRAVDPGVCAGFYAAEEVADFEQPAVRVEPLFPQAEPTSPPTPEPVAAPSESDENERASLIEIVGDQLTEAGIMPDAMQFLIELGRIEDGQSLDDLTLPQIQKLASGLDAFRAAVEKRRAAK